MATARDLARLASDISADSALAVGDDAATDLQQKFHVDAKITTVNGQISGLDTRLSSAETTITSNTAAASNAQTTADGNSTSISGLDSRLTTAEGTITSNTTATSTAQSTADGNATAISGLDTRVTTAEGDIDSLENRMAAAETASDPVALDAKYVEQTGDESIAGVKTFTGDVVFNGNVTQNGGTFTTQAETVEYADNTLLLNSNYVGALPTENAGIEVNRGGDVSNPNVSLLWDEANDQWITTDGTTNKVIAYQSDVAANTAAISANATNIATNTSDISTNAGNIATNASNISALQTDVATAQTDIGNNTAAITSNDGDISALDTRVTAIEGAQQTVSVDMPEEEVASAGKTVFNVAHSAGQVSVFLNGIRLQRGVEYTADATAGTVTISEGAAIGDWFAATGITIV